MSLITFIDRIATKVRFWKQVSSQRAALSRMSDEQLMDIGINRAEAVRESTRSFWDSAQFEDGEQRGEQPEALTLKYS